MSTDRTDAITHIELACDVCALEPRDGGAGPRGAWWAVAMKDCCAGGQLMAHLACDEHFFDLISQKLPGVCTSCGHLSRTLSDVVDVAWTIGTGTDLPGRPGR
ncbi:MULTISPECIES: hypothetical protein [Nocardiaceae]|uniref:Uncharacterized protein n=1 Tax=Rhodococcoides fascians D188 TaxID=1051973 RepID=G8JYX0_RHOFA|nr:MULTISPECIES: hypothetical protein [Rhodococcus]AET25241.1 hypothetical protein pFi_105 [Rhodococcus fascians D188]AMY56267.1 hypothetical protein A3L23_04969 [Rhodococcus fascians D188]OZC43776.1 hypothetical protein CH289_26615 [Rhodococcus sp. RS1C4]OZC51318.1 hypothetical protein CH267_20960 [Rhodococcus sp. 06-621-2]OZC60737.1 hypothetical protein CH277_27195 [Rhodococcus sp. 06-469-3-2]